MNQRLPTNCRQILLHLWARQDTDATINEVTPLNRAQLCESVFFFFLLLFIYFFFIHSQSSLTLLMNDPQTADELPTKIILFVGEAAHRRNHK